MRLKCIAIDDEPLALSIVVEYIKNSPCLELVSSYTDPVKAVEAIESSSVDLLFVDIQMPDLTGFQLLDKITNLPMVIFTTAYDNYAVDGFKYEAVDYLLKPIDIPDFDRAVSRAVRRVTTSVTVEPLRSFVYIKSGHKILRINFSDIKYIQGMSEYIKIYTSSTNPILTLLPLKTIESQLPKSQFMRVHKSYIVNLDNVTTIERGEIYYDDGKVIPISAQYREAFNEFIKQSVPI